ncbi:hypothetical protein MPTK2_3g00630 [Marchantia polymorpha subsp. ruderalis]
MGNLVRACLGRDYSALHFQRRRKLAWNLWIMCKVICSAVFDNTPRSAQADDNAALNQRSAAAMSPSTLLKLLYKRHVLKSQMDAQALSRCHNCSKDTECKFCSSTSKTNSSSASPASSKREADHGSSILHEKEMGDLSQSRALEILYRLNSEVQKLTTKLEKEEEEVKKLKDEISSLRATAAFGTSNAVQSPKSNQIQAQAATGNLLSDGRSAREDSNPFHEFCLSNGGQLVKLENVYMFQPVVYKSQKPCDEAMLGGLTTTTTTTGRMHDNAVSGNCNSKVEDQQQHLLHHSADLLHQQHQQQQQQSARKVGAKFVREHSLGEGLRPLKVQSNARRSVDCKCSPLHFQQLQQLERENQTPCGMDLNSPTRTEIEMDELDNLSNCSFESADTRDFEGVVATAKCLKRPAPEDFPDQMDWSSEDSAMDHHSMHMHREKSLHWTPTDPEIVASRRQVQQRYQELEEKLLKILQSPRREILPQLWSSNSSSCSSSGSSTPRSTTGSVSGHQANAAAGNGGGLFWYSARKLDSTRTRPDLTIDTKFDTEVVDFANQTSPASSEAPTLNVPVPVVMAPLPPPPPPPPAKVQTLPSATNTVSEFCVGKYDPKVPLHRRGTRQGEKVNVAALASPDLSRLAESSSEMAAESDGQLQLTTYVNRNVYADAKATEGESTREPEGSSIRSADHLWEEENDCDSDLEEVALETYKVYKSGDIYRHDNRTRNHRPERDSEALLSIADSTLYRESQGSTSSMSSGTNHLKRNLSFGPVGTRTQTRFGVEAARLSLRKHGLQRRGSF